MGRPPNYPSEFRREAVNLALSSDKSMAEVARGLGVHPKTLGNWITEERAELRVERETLRKAADYFARETTR